MAAFGITVGGIIIWLWGWAVGKDRIEELGTWVAVMGGLWLLYRLNFA